MYEYSSTFAWLAEVHAANNTEGFDIVELVELFEIEPRISKIDWQPPAMTHHLSIRLTSDSPNIVGTSTLIGILIGTNRYTTQSSQLLVRTSNLEGSPSLLETF